MRFGRDMRAGPPARFAAVAIVAGSALWALIGCTTVGDQLTGVTLHRAVPTTCMKQCSNQYRALYETELKQHLAIVEGCRSLAVTARGPCLESEGARHTAEMERLSSALSDCQASCPERAMGTDG